MAYYQVLKLVDCGTRVNGTEMLLPIHDENL